MGIILLSLIVGVIVLVADNVLNLLISRNVMHFSGNIFCLVLIDASSFFCVEFFCEVQLISSP